MASWKAIVGIVLAVAVASILLQPITMAVSTSTGIQTVDNETVTADVGNYTGLDGYYIQEDSEVVYGYNDTAGSYETLTEGTDYEMNYDAGQVKFLSGSSIVEDGEDVRVTYDYEATDDMTTTIIGYGPLFVAVLLLATVGMRVSDML